MALCVHKACLVSSLVLALLTFTNCASLKEGLSKVVNIEYEQSLNFQEYEFQKTIIVPPSGGSSKEWKTIRINDTSGREPKRGVWIVYQVCSIQNNASKAQLFNYDVSKFYVEYAGKKHYYNPLKPLAPYTYENQQLVPAYPAANDEVAPEFHDETQTGPDQQPIPPNSNNTLSVSWRFVIYVSTDLGDQTDLLNLNLPLRYDATPVIMEDRSHDTIPNNLVVHKGDLPTACRPPKN